jgi:hypothetical protein
MNNRDDSPYVWATLDGLGVADFGQLSPAQQSLVLMRAAQIQQEHTETVRDTNSFRCLTFATEDKTNAKHEEENQQAVNEANRTRDYSPERIFCKRHLGGNRGRCWVFCELYSRFDSGPLRDDGHKDPSIVTRTAEG